MVLLGTIEQHARRRNVIMPNVYLEMARRFGAYFQDLTIKVVGFIDKFPLECKRVIIELAKQCRLEKLTLDVGIILSKGAFGMNAPRKVHLDVLVELVENAFRMKSFYLKAWPLYRGIQRVDILEALKANPKLKNLERLDLFWQSAEGSTWATLNAILPSPDTMMSMVNHFNNLQYLALRSTMLREDIIEEFTRSSHTPLRKLAVLVTYSRYYQQENVPEISSAAWSRLCQCSPELEVEMTIATRMPYIELAAFLKPEIPVSALGFMKYSSLRIDDLESIRDKYWRTLRKFVSLVEAEDLDEQLKALVNKSTNLTSLVYHGSLYHQTILDIAAMKGNTWYRFDMPETAIKFGTPPDPNSDNNEEVVVQAADGTYQLAEMMRREVNDEQLREEKLKELVLWLSRVLDQKWRPLNMTLVEETLMDGAASLIQPEHVIQAASAAIEQQEDAAV